MSATGSSGTAPAAAWTTTTATRPSIAAAIASEICRDVDYRPVATDGAARAAAMLAILL